MTNQEELRERYRQSRAKSLALFAAIDARRRAESRAAEDTAHLRSHDDDRILRRDVEIDAIDDLEKWKADADVSKAARDHETRRRIRVVEAKMHEQRQRSDVIVTLQRDVAQHGADLVDALKAINTMASAAAKALDELGVEVAGLRERAVVAEAKAQAADVRMRDMQTELRNTAVELAAQKSRIADLDLALKQAIFDRKVAETAPMLRSNVN
jgi:hypothetical protein